MMQLLKIRYPIIQAPMAGGATTTALVAAVSNAGGLGSIAGAYLAPETLRTEIKKVRQISDQPFSVNLFVPEPIKKNDTKLRNMMDFLNAYCRHIGYPAIEPPQNIDYEKIFQEKINILLEEKVPAVSFTFGIPSSNIIQTLKANNIIIFGTATTVNEGILLAQAGCDIIVAQGSEAGGHRGTFQGAHNAALIGTMALIPQMVDSLDIPVIAAGGIMDARGLVAALSLGAAGVQMGTAFLTCTESGIHPAYKKAILNSTEESTVLTSSFSGKPARGIHNKFIHDLAQYEHENNIPDFPLQNELTKQIRAAAAQHNDINYMSLWAGQGTRLNKSMPAEQLIQNLVKDVCGILQKNTKLVDLLL